ncbi:hypothetical protein GCM10009827_049180 [Dactylosporangium maewongense]|uniref:Transposase n=1 Tax=Dactylosporangium maewongense TaxID=634393 RepID=A0ABP4LNC3_9ACTN
MITGAWTVDCDRGVRIRSLVAKIAVRIVFVLFNGVPARGTTPWREPPKPAVGEDPPIE